MKKNLRTLLLVGAAAVLAGGGYLLARVSPNALLAALALLFVAALVWAVREDRRSPGWRSSDERRREVRERKEEIERAARQRL